MEKQNLQAQFFFLLGKQHCAYCKMFGIRKDPVCVYRLLDVLHKPTVSESTSSASLHSTMIL